MYGQVFWARLCSVHWQLPEQWHAAAAAASSLRSTGGLNPKPNIFDRRTLRANIVPFEAAADLFAGDMLVLRGLKKKTNLNGTLVIVVYPIKKTGRWCVKSHVFNQEIFSPPGCI